MNLGEEGSPAKKAQREGDHHRQNRLFNRSKKKKKGAIFSFRKARRGNGVAPIKMERKNSWKTVEGPCPISGS